MLVSVFIEVDEFQRRPSSMIQTSPRDIALPEQLDPGGVLLANQRDRERLGRAARDLALA
jgi:hypothetical protein